jgi:DNA-binding SARP family transcriptional activator
MATGEGPFDEWLSCERARYAELASVACERLAELQAKQGRWNARSKRGSKLLAWSRGMKRITAS